jgi:hypothetical protein
MKIIEFFAGSRSIGKVAENAGHTVFSMDIYPFDGVDYVGDILDFSPTILPFIPDVVWFSPPCTTFSVASMGYHWTGGKGAYIPKTEAAILGLRILQKTTDLIKEFLKLNPDLIYWIENPRGVMRKMPQMVKFPRYTVSYCQYGDDRMKPTDIWTNSNTFVPKMCKNGATCHQSAPRGSRTGTQGLKDAYNRSKIPEKLCEAIIQSCYIKPEFF